MYILRALGLHCVAGKLISSVSVAKYVGTKRLVNKQSVYWLHHSYIVFYSPSYSYITTYMVVTLDRKL